MERVRGLTVREILQTCGRIEPKIAVSYTIRLAIGLSAAHHAGLCHRDIKPENIMISGDGRAHVWILDFGIALHMNERLAGEGTDRLGTVGYITPELALGEPVDERSDLYQVGLLLYEMLTGRKPFSHVNESQETEMHAAHAYAPPDPIPEIVPECPPVLWFLVLRLLAKKPADRFQSAKELIVALRAILFGRLSDTPSPSVSSGRERPESDVSPKSHVSPVAPIVITRAPVVSMEPIPIMRTRAASTGRLVERRAPSSLGSPTSGPPESDGGSMLPRTTLPMGTRAGLAKRLVPEETGARRTLVGLANGPPPEEAPRTVSLPPACAPAMRSPYPLAPPAATAPPERATISVLPGYVSGVRAPYPLAQPAPPASAPSRKHDAALGSLAILAALTSSAAPRREASTATVPTRAAKGTVAFLLGSCAIACVLLVRATWRGESIKVAEAKSAPVASGPARQMTEASVANAAADVASPGTEVPVTTAAATTEVPVLAATAATNATAASSASARSSRAASAPRVPRRPAQALGDTRNPWGRK